jgi:LytS/YehU family sensor histidine kinase
VAINGVTFIGYMCMQMLHHVFYESGPIKFFYFLNMHLSGATAMTIAAGFGIVFRIVMGWYEEMQQKQMLEEEKLRSELALLKAQVNPHFLFNTLNNIDSLIHTDAGKASEALIKLSTLLRYVIYDAVKDLVPLQLELGHIEAYIELQRLRYTNGREIQLEIKGQPGNRWIAPMLFIPFLENAFKHTDAEGIAKGMEICIQIDSGAIAFSCTNRISKRSPETSGGFGLDNVRKRLEIQYPGRHTLETGPEGELYITRLKLETT